jgi:DNA-directed RNA polymerase II subunit RPB2
MASTASAAPPPVQQQGSATRSLARNLIHKYFQTSAYPYTRHHIDSFDQFLTKDLTNIIRSHNPILILKDLIPDTNLYTYKVEIYVGGKDADTLEIGSPSISLQASEDVRLLFPNEARLRNLTYASTTYTDIYIRITITDIVDGQAQSRVHERTYEKFPLFKLPIMLHSSACLLHGKPAEFLEQAGECPLDHGGYFIVDGAEKVLITRQEQAFNTLYVSRQERDPKVATYASITCLSPTTRQVKRVAFGVSRATEAITVSIPFVRKPVPIFVLFRALGIQSDEEIMHTIFGSLDSADAQFLAQLLIPSIKDAAPFYNTYTAIQYIKTLTKGFGTEHVVDILRNQLFIHVENIPGARAIFLGDCVRQLLKVHSQMEPPTDRDDIRTQRCLTSGFLVQMLFSGLYKTWMKMVNLRVSEEYNYNKSVYSGDNFPNIFSPGNLSTVLAASHITEGITRGFKGKWGSGLGEEKTGALQSLSRLSYLDFMSHCRRVVLDFDTGMKLVGPRHLHPSQYGYFCTNETPGGASIGIAKNLSILTMVSTGVQPAPVLSWLWGRGKVVRPAFIPPEQRLVLTPVYVNAGIIGYVADPVSLVRVLRVMKHTAWMPASAAVVFNIRQRAVQIYLDEGRPMRPLILVTAGRFPAERLQALSTWRDIVMGTHPGRLAAGLASSEFADPLADTATTPSYEDYIRALAPHAGVVEYVDPYEHNQAYIANYPEQIRPETTHVEIHPSTMLSAINSLIPFLNHNQSPRNQLSCSQSKQAISLYATNWKNRYDNTANVLCYGEAPLVRSIYADYLGEGRTPYGQNVVVAIAAYTGYNQEDGIVMNADACARGLFRNITYKSYQAYEEDDDRAHTRTRIANPKAVAAWMDLRPGCDYSKLDDRGIVRVGEFVDENTVIVGMFMRNERGDHKDSSVTAQVWTSGRVESVVVTVSNAGLRLVKIRVSQDRTPQLGDKFCLTEDHDVCTTSGWKPIKDVTVADMVIQRHSSGSFEYVKPIATQSYAHTGIIYEFGCSAGTQKVTPDHRMFVWVGSEWRIMKAFELYILMIQPTHPAIYFEAPTVPLKQAEGGRYEVIFAKQHLSNPVGKAVYCLTVPTGIFLVRQRGSQRGVWTGNSNRHGQKGTIGMLVRGVDMPRTAAGIVPDMIMNPHAIPSRMTMAQIIEQLAGKHAVKAGGLADGTGFMNEGSPVDYYGLQLEKLGFERYGNEIMYNGMTGQQIPTTIFVGPLYGMRLKHMVEDKWQARGQGRREQRTHQPTGGRGNQGGLKIGELERDSISAHGVTTFLRESFMKRSDGVEVHMCSGCGTVPVYNERMNLAVCTLCSGPVGFSGSTRDTLELVPPAKRSAPEIVKVEMPYATKLFAQELGSFLNIGMRFLTTRGIQRLRVPANVMAGMTGAAEGSSEPLPERVLPDMNIPEMQEGPVVTTVEDLAAIANTMGMAVVPMAESTVEIEPEAEMPAPSATESESESEPAPESEGSLDTFPGAIPGEEPTIVIDTSEPAMQSDGIAISDATGVAPDVEVTQPPRRTLRIVRGAEGPAPVGVEEPAAVPQATGGALKIIKIG